MNFALFAAACKAPGLFLGIFPVWYEYIVDPSNCQPAFKSLSDIWLIVAAIIDILLRVGSIVAVIIVIMGGIEFITSQGSPEGTTKARNTVINALIGLAISVTASIFIGFLAGQLH